MDSPGETKEFCAPPDGGRGGLRDALSLDRRGFLKVMGVGAAAALAGCQRLPVKHVMPFLIPPEEITPGVPVLYASTCSACPAACGMMVTCRDGRPVKLEGRPDHPLSRGGLCALGQAHLRGLYDPDRLHGPTLEGREVTWDRLDAWVRERLGALAGAKRELVVLSRTLTSPTARSTTEEFLEPFGGSLVEYDPWPGAPSAAMQAYEALAGRPLLPYPLYEAADLLLVLGADPLGTGVDPVGAAAAYAARKGMGSARAPFRHVQVEGSWSLTGAAADERWTASAADRTNLALLLLDAVAARRGAAGGPRARVPGEAAARLGGRARELAEELLRRASRCLVLSGSDDPQEQAAVAVLNRLLGNEGCTLDLERPLRTRRGLDRDLLSLLDRLAGGEIGGLLLLDSDPVDDLPGGEALAGAISDLDLSVAITASPTASATACRAVAAGHHGLECWNDFEPREGVLTLAQPAVRPLFGTRHPMESLLRWSGAETADYRLRLKRSWRERFTDVNDFEVFWDRSVAGGRPVAQPVTAAAAPSSDGTQPQGGTPPSGPISQSAWALAAFSAPRPEGEGMEVELLAEVGRRDGTHARVPWLRELPDPLTRVSWLPVARLAPETADRMGVEDGDLLDVDTGEAAVVLPARVLPGQDPGVLGIPVGYGLQGESGPAGPANAYRIAAWRDRRLVRSGLRAAVRRTGGRVDLPLMQVHMRTEGRPLIHEVRRPDEEVKGKPHGGPGGLWPEQPRTSPHWEMVIDLDACTGCSACVIACQAENNIAVVGPDEMRRQRDMHWLRIDRYFRGDGETTRTLFEPMLCQQCDDAPCETVCPVSATVHSEDGLNMQAYNRCVGTRYCANNCPYKVRRFNWFDNASGYRPLERMALNPDVVVRDRGVMEKCTFCVQRIQASRIHGRNTGGPWVTEVQTACQQSCPARAIRFGDGMDPDSEVSRLRRGPRAFQVLAELGIEPSISYLARVRNEQSGDGGGT